MDEINFALLGNRFPEARHFFRKILKFICPVRYQIFPVLAYFALAFIPEQIMSRTMTALKGLQQDS
jgi:hypothetical protein